MPITAPSLPLTQAAFADALRTGHGRVIQQLENHGAIGLENLIVDACVACLTYDPQCEEERAPWLYSIVERAQLSARVVQAIEAIKHEPSSETHRDVAERCAILKELAVSGSADARRLLYASLARLSNTADVIGADEIIALDGVEGLIHVARQFGRWLQADPQFWVEDLSTQLDESIGVDVGLAALEREAIVDSDIAFYLAGVHKANDNLEVASARIDPATLTAIEVMAHVKKNPKDPCPWLSRWGLQADNDERETVFAALLASQEPEHAQRLFRCFAQTGLPRFERRLLQWMDHPNERIQWAAMRALAPITHPELRQAAKRLMGDGYMATGIALLVSNFEKGDFSMCAKHLPKLADADEIHRFIGPLLDVCVAHLDEEARDCLLYVYEFSPCSICRSRAVKALIKSNIAPEWVLAESAFDADSDTRALVGGDGDRIQGFDQLFSMVSDIANGLADAVPLRLQDGPTVLLSNNRISASKD